MTDQAVGGSLKYGGHVAGWQVRALLESEQQ